MALGGEKIEWSAEAPTREKLWFFAVLGLVLYAFGTLMWGPQRDRTKDARDEAKQLQSQIEAVEKVLAVEVQPSVPTPEAPAASKTMARADPRFAAYLKGEFKTQEQVLQEVSTELATPKTLGQVVLSAIDFGEGTDKGDYLEIPFDLRVEGTYQDTVGYLQRIEKIPVLVVFRGVSVQAKPENPARLETHLASSAFVVKSAATLKQQTEGSSTGEKP